MNNPGFTLIRGIDNRSERPCALAVNEYGTNRAWGAYLKDTSRPVRLIIEAPHPVADQNSERIALALWREIPGSFLMIAGAHRRAGGPGGNQGLADVPWNPGSMFNKVAGHLMPLPQLQVHGFANSTAPDKDVVLATGSAPENQTIKDIADALEMAGFRVGRVWEGYPVLTARGNEQSKIARDAGTDFMHIEINRTVRLSTTLSSALGATVARSIV